MALSQRKHPVQTELTTQELRTISLAISRDFSPYIVPRYKSRLTSAAFSVQELLTISQEINREYSHNVSTRVSQLVLMPIEPGKLHVYWQFDQQKTELANVEDKPLTLRIYETANQAPDAQSKDLPVPAISLDFAITADQGQQDINLPMALPNLNPVTLNAEIGYYPQPECFFPVISSKATHMPTTNKIIDNNVLPTVVAQFIIPATNTNSVSRQTRIFSE